MKRYHLEVWNRTNTQRRAIFGALLRAERRQVLQAEEEAVFEVPASDAAADELTTGAVLRLQEEGLATGFSLWRLTATRKSRDAQGRLTLVLTADALWMDLRQGIVRQLMQDGRPQMVFGLIGLSPEVWLSDIILPSYDGDAIGFVAGTVEPTDPVDLSFEHTSPLAALRALEEAAGGEAQFRLSPDGTFYFVDLLTRIGQTQAGAELRYGKNVRGLSRAVDEADIQTRLYASGGGLLTLADAEWTVAGVGGAAGARILTFSGMSPVFEDGAHVGLWFYAATHGAYPITASSAADGSITVDDTALPPLEPGVRGWIATSAGGARLAYLESPAGVAEYGVRVGHVPADDVPDAANLVPHGDLAAETAGMPTGWATEGAPVVTRTTDPVYARRGGVAWRVQAAADGEGLISDPFQIPALADRPYTALRVGLTVASGKVRVELRHSNGQVYPVSQRPSSEGVGVYLELTAGPMHDEPLPAGTAQLAIVAHGGAADVYVDCAMVTPVVGSDVPAFVGGSGAHLLWQRAAAELAERRLPRVEYQVDVADLHLADPERFRFDELRLGDDVQLRDPDIGRATVRIVEIVQDLVRAEATRVALADSPRRRVHDPLRPAPPAVGGRMPGPGPDVPTPSRAAVLSHAALFDPHDGLLYVAVLGNAATATLELYLKTNRTAAYPPSPVATIAARQGTFPGQPLAEARFYRIVPRDGRGVAGEAAEGGGASYAPTAAGRVELTTARDAADIYLTGDSPIGEGVRLHVRDSEDAGAAVWSLVQGDGDSTPRYVTDGSEIGPESWFHDGSSYAQKLAAVPLSRDQLRRLWVQAEGQLSALRSTWTPIALELRAQPWLESFGATWDEDTDTIPATAIGGAHCQSARWEWSQDDFATVAHAIDASLGDGQRVTQSHAVPPSERGREWWVRCIPFNGPLQGGVCTGLAGVPMEMPVPVPPLRNWVEIQSVKHGSKPPEVKATIAFGPDTRSVKVELTPTPPAAVGGAVSHWELHDNPAIVWADDGNGNAILIDPADPTEYELTITPYTGWDSATFTVAGTPGQPAKALLEPQRPRRVFEDGLVLPVGPGKWFPE